MKKILFTLAAFGLWCMLSVAAYAQTCITFDDIAPASIPPLIVGSNNYNGFTAKSNGKNYEQGPVYTITAGALPPGVAIIENTLRGVPTKAGTYSFTLGVLSEPGCPIFEKQYTVEVLWNLPCDKFDLETPYGETGYHLVGVYEFFGICPTYYWDSIQYTTLSLPPNFTLRQFDNNYCPEVWGPPLDTGTFTIAVEGSVPSGCRDTVIFTHHWGCISIDSIYPQPYQLATLPVVVGKPVNRAFIVGFTPYEVEVPFIFKTLNGTSLPPGLYFENDPANIYISYLKGTPTTAGVYHFTVGAQLGNACIVVQHDYTLTVYDTFPCSALKFYQPYVEDQPGGTYAYVGAYQSLRTCLRTQGWDSVQFSLPEAPPGFSLYADGSECLRVAGHSLVSGTQNFAIAVTTAGGCQDTVRFTRMYTCAPVDSMRPASPQLPVAMSQTFYSQQLSIGPFYTTLQGAHFTVTSGSLPPGLSLYDSTNATAYLRGTPTAAGNYTFTISAAIGNCPPFSKTYTLKVTPHQTVKSLVLTPLCIEDVETRSWQVYNPNNFNVPFTWETVYFEYDSRMLTAAPGYTFFKTNNVANPNSVRITWRDESYTSRSIVRGASSTYCNPPACVVAASVVSFHQGLRVDGGEVFEDNSDVTTTLGEPGVAVGLHTAFSLGLNGFVVLELSSRVYDQPGLDLLVTESSFETHFASNPERAEVFVSKNGTQWISLGYTGSPQNCSEHQSHAFDLSGKTDWCRYVKVVDKTDRHAKVLIPLSCQPTSVPAFTNYDDGFDLDAVTCAQGTTFARQEAPETTASHAYILYPNPAKDWLMVDFSNEKLADDKQVEISIRDLSGRDLYKQIHTLEGGTTRCEVTSFKTGMYILHARGANGASGYYKFMKD
ncbi:MAG TPA: putative Ig domain-containing protein [Ohtaekwangia sp.]|uniref:putative Ig domain-containing protein n=1 Tax=Ohtaekwangia sp. TaxID=2066019 RepID=UPI002F923956